MNHSSLSKIVVPIPDNIVKGKNKNVLLLSRDIIFSQCPTIEHKPLRQRLSTNLSFSLTRFHSIWSYFEGEKMNKFEPMFINPKTKKGKKSSKPFFCYLSDKLTSHSASYTLYLAYLYIVY